MSDRASHEVAHGRFLATEGPESQWGWGTPAGRERADRRAKLIVEGARLSPATRALEVGCGAGLFTEKFARSGSHLVAVDISPDLLALARARGLNPERVRFVHRRFEECDVEGPFDAVIGSSVLHHLELDEALTRILELLRPGGWLSFAEPNLLNPQVYLERRFRRWFPYVSPDETAFTRSVLSKDLESAGFEAIDIQPFDWLHPSTPSACIRLVDSLGRAVERVPGVREFAGSLAIRARKPESPEA